MPTERNHDAPKRATSARCASVSTFRTSVGAPSTPLSYGRGGVNVGSAGPPFRNWTSAVSSPATNRSGTTAVCTLMPPSRRRSAIACATAARTVAVVATTTCRASTARAASTAPSMTRCGAYASSTLSLPDGGSPSVPFATTIGRVRRPQHRVELDAGRKRRAAPAGEPRGGDAVAQLCGRKLEWQRAVPRAVLRERHRAAVAAQAAEQARRRRRSDSLLERAHQLELGVPWTVPVAVPVAESTCRSTRSESRLDDCPFSDRAMRVPSSPTIFPTYASG